MLKLWHYVWHHVSKYSCDVWRRKCGSAGGVLYTVQQINSRMEHPLYICKYQGLLTTWNPNCTCGLHMLEAQLESGRKMLMYLLGQHTGIWQVSVGRLAKYMIPVPGLVNSFKQLLVKFSSYQHSSNLLRPCPNCVQSRISDDPTHWVVFKPVVSAIAINHFSPSLTIDVAVSTEALHSLQCNLDSPLGRVQDRSRTILL